MTYLALRRRSSVTLWMGFSLALLLSLAPISMVGSYELGSFRILLSLRMRCMRLY